MDNNNPWFPIVQFIEKYAAGLGYIVTAILGYMAPTLVNRMTGRDKAEIHSIQQKTKDDNDTAVAGAAKTLIETTELVTKMYGDLNREQQEMYEARIKILTDENKDLRKDAESVKERLNRQIKKLQEQLEMLRGELRQVRAEREAYHKQLKDERIVPVIVPLFAERKSE
jgi:uncharacterized membrane protein YgaE (UPF0421/DUF939 family)